METKPKTAYLFLVGEDANEMAEFQNAAVFVKTFNSGVDRDSAVADVRGDLAALPAAGWTQTSYAHAPGGLDMRFPKDTQAWVIVRLPDTLSDKGTFFANKGVADMPVRGRGRCKVVSSRHVYERTNDTYGNDLDKTIVAFKIDITKSIGDLDGTTNHHAVGRLPFMFDFEDLPGNLSPVFKEPHHRHLVMKKAPIFNHGGIHPPTSASNMHVDP